jgi:hypothetical protein
MSFKKITRKPSGKGEFAFNTVRLRSSEKRVEITVSADLWRDMGEPDKVLIMRGLGGDFGKIALMPDETVDAYKLNKAHTRAETRVANIARPKLGLVIFEPMSAKYRLRDRRLIVTIPTNLFEASPASPPDPSFPTPALK